MTGARKGRAGRHAAALGHHRRRIAILVGLAVAAAVAALYVLPLVSARRALKQAEGHAQAAAQALQGGDRNLASGRLDDASAALARAVRVTRSPVLRVARLVPIAGSPVRAVSAGTAAGNHVVAAGRALDGVFDELERPTDVGDYQNSVRVRAAAVAMRRAMADAQRRLRMAERALSPVVGATLPPVAHAAARARSGLQQSMKQLEAGDRAAGLVEQLTDPAADVRLLVLSQDTQELRATGGFVGTFGILRLGGGRIELERFQSYEDLPAPDPPLAPPEPLADWLPSFWGISNVNWWPDFPTTADRAAEMLDRQGGGEVDGVVAITERLLVDLLEVLGPVPLPSYEPVVAAGLAQRIVYEVELKEPLDTPRKKFLMELSQQVFERTMQLPGDQYPRAAAAFGRAAGAGDLQLWFRDPERQDVVSGSVMSGELPATTGDFLMLVEANRSAGKANQGLVRDVRYSVVRTPQGHIEATLDADYRNDGVKTTVNPFYFGYLRVYVPRGSRLLSGGDDAGPADDGPFQVFSRDVFVKPGAETGFTMRWRLPDRVAPGGDYRLTWLRQAGTPQDRLEAAIAGARMRADPASRVLKVKGRIKGNPLADLIRRSRAYELLDP